MIDALWDPDADFFKVRFEEGGLSDAREAIGIIPWMFDLAGAGTRGGVAADQGSGRLLGAVG